MMGAVIILALCLASSPSSCREERLTVDLPLLQCQAAGQQIAAEWIGDHPAWQLAGWRCAAPARDGRA